MSKMVTIDVLKESQPSRPRHWIPVFAFLAFLISAVVGVVYMALVIPGVPFFESIVAMFPAMSIELNGKSFELVFLLKILFFPAGIFLLFLIFTIVAVRICIYRHAYWWLGAFMLTAIIVQPLLTGFWALYYLVPNMDTTLAGIPAQVMGILLQVHGYMNFGIPFLHTLFWLLCMLYNVTYPLKYSEIYDLRSARLAACGNSDERIEYKNRFYNDYKKGNWISMMLDLHFESLDPKSTKPMREDAFEFLIYYANICDSNVNEAIFKQYASQGRYYECRTLFHDALKKSESIDKGAKVVLPHYVAPKANKKPVFAKKPLKSETPKRVEPPLKPAAYKKPANSRVKTWTPDDI
ncbi:MAG: hypothetical protein K6E59_03805 [Bacilli bacterium]|nr:hypothetical protein [Bacilli bacterium]